MQKIAPIDDTPEDYGGGESQARSPRRDGGAANASRTMRATTSSPGRGKYMANQRALEMESESEDEDELVTAATAKATQEGDEFSNVPAPGVKPLLLASPNAKKLALERKTKKPTIVFDDEDDEDEEEEIMPTQTASQMQTSPPKKSPKRASTSPGSPAKRRKVVAPEVPASPPIGIVGRVVNAAAEALGFSSPFKASQAGAPESPLVGAAGFASPSAPTSLMMSPGTMTNIVGSVARSVLDDDEDHAGKVEWGSRGGYEGGKRGARRKLDLADENASPSKKSKTARALERLR